MASIRFLFALIVSRLAAFAIKIIDKERGTTLPGKIALKIDPAFIRHIKGAAPERTVFVTGTNGKSTTTNLLAAMLRESGLSLAVNLEGANLLAGVAAALLKNATLFGRLKTAYLLLETDERFLPVISRELTPGHLLITNIQKDQVQRNGEPDIIYRKLKQVIRPETQVYLNNEDPYTASLLRFSDRPVFYGVAANEKSFIKEDFYTTTLPCPICGAPIAFAYYNIDNIGPFRCESCGFASQEQPRYLLEHIDYQNHTYQMNGHTWPFRYDAPYFLYCYAAALAVAQELGLPKTAIYKAAGEFVNIGGRLEDIRAGGKTIHYIRMKQENPETLQSALDYIAEDPREKIFLLGLEELVDFRPHYTNTFYAYDCDFQDLIASQVQRYICFSDTVSYDTALRLLYAGAPREKISVVPSNDDAAIIAELQKYPAEQVYLITWLKKFHELKKYAAKNPQPEGSAR